MGVIVRIEITAREYRVFYSGRSCDSAFGLLVDDWTHQTFRKMHSDRQPLIVAENMRDSACADTSPATYLESAENPRIYRQGLGEIFERLSAFLSANNLQIRYRFRSLNSV